MSCVLDFIFENWMILIPCLCGFIEFLVLLIIKKRPKIIDSSIYSEIVFLVQEAEKKFGSGRGKEKLLFVIKELAIRRDMSDIKAMVCYRSFIENVLNTPHKKGGKE